MAQLENGAQSARAASIPQAQSSQILDFPPSVNEGKDATVHDFLSLGGSKNLSCTAPQVLGVTVTTQDLLQPLENNRMPSSSTGLLPHGLEMGAVRTHSASVEYAGQQASYAVVNGSLDLPSNARYKTITEGLTEGMKERLENLAHWSGVPSKYRPSDLAYPGKAHLPQALLPAVNKRWQHQQQASSEALETSRKASKVPSEEEDDEDDELFDYAYSSKKEIYYPKSDASHKLEGKTHDLKASTPRSKHSATEQRRRSKINDRFQMLRQLLPNVDQKRDKASFLLEVIEYIQMLQDKVNKFETVEHGRLQERTKASQWDAMNSACRDSTANSAYLPIVSGVTIDAKEGPDSNGYIKKRTSPLRATCENEGSSSELMSGMGQALVFQSRVSQGPQACLSSYDNKVAANKPISLTLSSMQPLPFERIPTSGFPSTELRTAGFPSVPQPISEVRAVFDQLLKHEEQTSLALEAKGSSTNKLDGQLQANNVAVPSQRSSEEEFDLQKNDMCMPKECRKEDSIRSAAITEGNEANLKKNDLELDEQEPLVVHGGIIKISSMYSQGLLDTLTQALQSSGVDLTQATISVQIDLGKPGGGVIASSRKTISPSTSLQPPQKKESGSSMKSEHTRKKLKIEMDG